MYFFTCRLLGYVSHRGVIKPSPCLKNKNGAVSFSFEVRIFLVLHPASKLGTNESGVS